jgi:hypothetical protein
MKRIAIIIMLSHIDMKIGDESQDSVTDDATDMESTPTVKNQYRTVAAKISFN